MAKDFSKATEKQIRKYFVDMAKTFLGCTQGDKYHKQLMDIYNTIRPLPRGHVMSYTDYWCAAFVSAVAKACDLTSVVLPECGCISMINLYKKVDRWIEDDAYVPKQGDLIFYDWDDSGIGDCNNGNDSDHVGIVVEVASNTITVIEGNMGSKPTKVGYRTVTVNGRFIRGYAVPDYASLIKGKATKIKKPKKSKKPTNIEIAKLVVRGDYGVGKDRAKKLELDGYNPETIQKIVNNYYASGKWYE